jgi:hypothetical protein
MAAARQELFVHLSSLPELVDCAIFDHEPHTLNKTPAVTVTAAGFTPTDWQLTVRIYVKGDRGPQIAQIELDDLAGQVDRHIRDGGGNGTVFGPSQCTFGWVEDIQCHVAELQIVRGREDYF